MYNKKDSKYLKKTKDKKMHLFGSGWAINVSIAIAVLSIIMLIILLVAAMQIKPPQDDAANKYFERSFLEISAQYNRTVLLLSIAERFLTWIFFGAVLLIFWRSSLFINRIPIFTAVAIFAVFNIVLFLILLPLQYYRGFIIDHNFGLSNQTLSAWFLDILKDRAISLVINTAALTLIYILLDIYIQILVGYHCRYFYYFYCNLKFYFPGYNRPSFL